MQFVRDFIGRSVSVRRCLECELGNHAIMSPGGLIYENDYITVHPHTYARMTGFVVISPKVHVAYESELRSVVKLSINLAISAVKQGFEKYKYADEVSVFKKEGEHLEYWVVAKCAPVLEQEFDLSIFESDLGMIKNGLKVASGGDIMYMTVLLRGYFEKFFSNTSIEECKECNEEIGVETNS